ncbi:MAG TPA: SPOR domain-containing protein [Candidatus Polarisedimenticolia bacterium]|nr:SPOR domain-containing protein [Candidatus Polarisedimenticolia bacterium]
MTETRRAKWLLAIVVMTSGALLGLLRWAGRAAAAPETPEETVAVEVGKPVTAGTTPGLDLSFYRVLGGGSGRRSGATAPPPDTRGLRPDPGERAAPTGAYIVQVMATRDEAQAKRLVDRLARRGYPAAVLDDAAAGGALFRVRVGRYKERASADAMADKLRDRERLEPWVLQEAAP